MLEALGLIALVALILAGALMPLKYTARMNLPKKRKEPEPSPQGDEASERDERRSP